MAGFRCYIDGLNLYYGILKGTDLKWLDPVALCERLAGDRPDLVRYFTARVTSYPTNRGAHQRQDKYLTALDSMPEIEIHEGQFMRHDRRRPLSSSLIGPNPSPEYVKVSLTEEKGSDVNLASWLLWDAISGDCTEAVVITNDSDLATPLDMVANKLSVPLTLINPQLRSPTAYALQKVGVATKQLHLRTIKRCQLPNPVVDPAGRQIRKPRDWFNRY